MSALYFFFLMIRRPPRSTLFPTRRSSDLLRAWFVDDATRMSPHLLYAQAIKGRFTGRGTGIIDTLHLVEVARAAGQLDLKRSEEHTSELQSLRHLVCRLLLEKKKTHFSYD